MPTKESEQVIYLQHPSGSTAEVSLFGATVTSWVVENVERIFVSKKAKRDGTKAIRGGIPICFPIFGTKEKIDLPQHGFARNHYWEYTGIMKDDDDEVSVRFGLKDTQLPHETRKRWSHSFRLHYTVTLGEKTLKTFFSLKNEDEDTFEFNMLLHTYFLVPDITKVAVQGLTSCEYIDKVQNGINVTEENEKVTINGEVDRVYKKVQDKVLLEVNNDSTIQIEKFNLKDTVVWNPWIEKAKSMADFDDEEYKNMICVEVGSVAEWVVLAGGSTWTAGQTLTIV
ncbi:galactose mutarotase-like domain-containing protein [Cokeromyces recurvatus]|uniref:galactose mutarotase-like domain-containing protein n=1 Tax=Cokeromyces recurvatus TaxID=90255 RepID=UPI00221EBA50|nr:galactose mutarotase-like domain-containing protein [Cokeromyces recurvatus]KAI7908181.1 galactose mutarotase-like domain-containing protein [Cokeromyces recurvatus]